jgi:hypothetical protein
MFLSRFQFHIILVFSLSIPHHPRLAFWHRRRHPFTIQRMKTFLHLSLSKCFSVDGADFFPFPKRIEFTAEVTNHP